MKQSATLRWKIILVVMIVLMGTLLWRLYDLTINQGESFNALSASRRTKEIQIPAPRGNIYDRNGVLLAGTRTSFSVQGSKDEFLSMTPEERNPVIAQLLRLVERDGADYAQDSPISVDAFVYASDEDYLKEKETPDEKVQRLLVENKLVGAWLSSVYEAEQDPDFHVSPAARALTSFSLKGSALPIQMDPDQNFSMSFKKGDEYQKLVDSGAIGAETTPLDLLVQRVMENRNILAQTLNHPAARVLAFRLLSEKKLQGDLQLAPFVYTYEESFRQKKASYHRTFPDITLTSDAKDDFMTIVRTQAASRFLESVEVSEENQFSIPAEEILNRLADKNIDSNLTYSIASDAESVAIEYIKEEDTEEKPVDRLVRLARENDLLDAVIVDDRYKALAEQAMFDEGLYPGISISSWKYGLQTSQEDFIQKHELKGKRADEAFSELLKEYKIDASLDPVVQIGMMMITDAVDRPGSYAYWPVNLCYELSPETVAKIEERIPTSTGFMVTQQPIRYYPFGESASHVLGYIGKIATDSEIETYVNKQGYLPNEFIGKTGVEQSFEDTLHGVNGKEVVLVDSNGNRTETLERQEPKAGNNIYLTIDIGLQQQSEKSVRNAILSIKHGLSYASEWGTSSTAYSPTANSGASVSVNPQDGSVLALASYPMFDPNLFVTGISNADWKLYQPDDKADKEAPKPLMNLATQTAVQPGSTFKTVVGLSGLRKGLDPNMQIVDRGFVKIGDRQFNNLLYTLTGGTDGAIDLYDALGVSNNYYFYILGLGEVPATGEEIGVKVTVDDIESTAKLLGLDRPTGLEIKQPGEVPNQIPSRAAKVELAKALLRNYLSAHLAEFKTPGTTKTRTMIEEDIKTILEWSDRGEEMGRTELIDLLNHLGYQSEEPLSGQSAGLADILKYTYFNQIDWTVADSMNAVIGQGQNAYTPVSVLMYGTIFANHGTRYNFTLIKEVRSADNQTVLFEQTPKGEAIDLPTSYFDDIREGMRRSALHNESQFAGLPFPVGSKTGTAERGGVDPRTGGNYAPYAWDISFAPFDDPKIATVTFLPDGMSSINAVPVSRDVIARYFNVEAHQDISDQRYQGLKTYYPEKEGSGNQTSD